MPDPAALKSEANCWGIESLAAHPGVCQTDLLHSAPGRKSAVGRMWSLTKFMFQSASQGALPTLYAATSPDARAGAYYGPDKLNELRDLWWKEAERNNALPLDHNMGTGRAMRVILAKGDKRDKYT